MFRTTDSVATASYLVHLDLHMAVELLHTSAEHSSGHGNYVTSHETTKGYNSNYSECNDNDDNDDDAECPSPQMILVQCKLIGQAAVMDVVPYGLACITIKKNPLQKNVRFVPKKNLASIQKTQRCTKNLPFVPNSCPFIQKKTPYGPR